ncbi:DUF7541 family protein [Haloferacaceae archaeon DSL9]
MDETPGLSDQYRKASPWPFFIAIGLVLAEVGIVFELVPVAVGGLLLFCICIAGVLRESTYVNSPWTSLAILAGLLAVFGFWLLYVDPRVDVSLAVRAYSVLGAAVILGAGAAAGRFLIPKQQFP